MPEPRRSQLSRLLDRPDARPRVKRAVASLLAASVAAIAVLGVLVIWHLVRRARLIREGLNPPRSVSWPEVRPIGRDAGPTTETEPRDDGASEIERRET